MNPLRYKWEVIKYIKVWRIRVGQQQKTMTREVDTPWIITLNAYLLTTPLFVNIKIENKRYVLSMLYIYIFEGK